MIESMEVNKMVYIDFDGVILDTEDLLFMNGERIQIDINCLNMIKLSIFKNQIGIIL